MGRKSRKEARRAEIIEAFSRVLADHGYAGATINAVAVEAGLAPGLLHHNFKNKQEMLNELFVTLAKKFKDRVKDMDSSDEPIMDYINAALRLDHQSDQVAAKCWVGVLAEALREPELFERVKRHLDSEIKHLTRVSGGALDTKDASAVISFVLGSLVMGAFAPRRTAGFAAPAGEKFVNALTR